MGRAGVLLGRPEAAAGGGALYAPGAPFRFTYPPFAALLFAAGAGATVAAMKIAITVGSLVALPVLCGQALAGCGVRRRPEIIFAVSALALLTWPVTYTLHLGEVNLILAALIGADLLRPRDGAWWQGIGTGLAAGVKLTPLIFVVYLLLTRRVRAAVTAARDLRRHGRVRDSPGCPRRPGRSGWAGCSTTSSGSATRPTRRTSPCPGRWPGWPDRRPAARLVAGRGARGRAGGPGRAVWAHRRGYRMSGFLCCAFTGLLVSPISWTHHWVWTVPLLVWLIVTAWRRRSRPCDAGGGHGRGVFSGFMPLPWPGHPADAGLMAASDLYVLFGLAVLAATGVALARER